MSNDALRAYIAERRQFLAKVRTEYGAKHALSADKLGRSTFSDRDFGAVSTAKENFGTYRWIQGRAAEIDDLIRFLDQQERSK